MKYGIQTYSLGGLMDNYDSASKALTQVASMGAEVIEICYNDKITAKQYIDISTNTGLTICSTHSSLNRILNDTERLIDEHLSFGCKIIGIGGKLLKSKFGTRRFCAKFEKASQIAEKYGVALHYHNHAHELKMLKNGNRILDEIMLNTSHNVKLCLDIAWTKKGGANSIDYFEKYRDRVAVIHLKDYSVAMKDTTDLGDGDAMVLECIAKGIEVGSLYGIIEEERGNALINIAKSFEYLKTNKII